jgi:NAD(P)H-flavin reductase
LFQYQTYQEQDGDLQAVPIAEHCKQTDFGPFTSYQVNDRRVSFLGDTHPVFHGSVVKAIASGLRTYPHIVQHFGERVSQRGDAADYQAFRAQMSDLLTARVESVQRHSPTVVEVKVRAPMAARKFSPGQFFRVQNYESLAPVVHNTRLQTEAIAMLGAGVAPDSGLISLMVLEKGASSRLFATFKPGMPLSLMGPTGVRASIPEQPETVMLIGGRLGAAEIMVVGPALKAAGHRVLYIAGFQTADEAYNQSALEHAADAIVWITKLGPPIKPNRPQDCAASGHFIDLLQQYAAGQLAGPPAIPLETVNRVLVIGSNRLLQLINQARHAELSPYFTQNPAFFASVYSTMQCMLKGVCAQCLQWQIDPTTGQRTKAVFACSWQMQPMDMIDLPNLDERLAQNRMQEYLGNLWLDYVLGWG